MKNLKFLKEFFYFRLYLLQFDILNRLENLIQFLILQPKLKELQETTNLKFYNILNYFFMVKLRVIQTIRVLQLFLWFIYIILIRIVRNILINFYYDYVEFVYNCNQVILKHILNNNTELVSNEFMNKFLLDFLCQIRDYYLRFCILFLVIVFFFISYNIMKFLKKINKFLLNIKLNLFYRLICYLLSLSNKLKYKKDSEEFINELKALIEDFQKKAIKKKKIIKCK